MVDLLVKLLGPTLYNLGVSEADLISYLTQLEGYIYAIIAAVVVLSSCDVPCSLCEKGISLCSSS
ncbi:MAG: hypothetical protein ACLVBP_03825 [Ruminococcus sp.]